MPDALTAAVRHVLQDAEAAATTRPTGDLLRRTRERLDEPLRLAVAGKVKAGKSTLLNALLAEELAPTDAGECTRIVTWYRCGPAPRVTVHPRGGPPEERPYDRSSGALEVDLGGREAGDVDHLDVRWPSSRLEDLTLVDTPGIASLSTDLSAATYRALTPEEDRPAEADAVLYLLRHTHASDVRFLEAFHDEELAHATPMNAVGVLSRADEIGSCRLDALDVAARVAARYPQDPRMRRLCPLVLPVSGLLGLAAETLRPAELAALRSLAAAPAGEVDELLLTADRFAHHPGSVVVTPLERAHLLDRLGLFGVRLAVHLLRAGDAGERTLAAELGRRSGLARLRVVLREQFTRRAEVLKARSALAALGGVLAAGGCEGGEVLQARAEEIASQAHAFVEVRLLQSLASGAVKLTGDRRTELERLLGAGGHDPATRLGLLDPAPEDVDAAARDALRRWTRVAEHPLSDRSVQGAARVATRTLEGLLAGAT